MDDYRPIDCSLHDRLEELATLGQPALISYRDEHGESRAAEDRIEDVFAEGGAEYLRTSGGERIRLDRIDDVDGRSFRSGQD